MDEAELLVLVVSSRCTALFAVGAGASVCVCVCCVGLSLLLVLCWLAGVSVDEAALLVLMASSRYIVLSPVEAVLLIVVVLSGLHVPAGGVRLCHMHMVLAQ